jgi:hypothetical protein
MSPISCRWLPHEAQGSGNQHNGDGLYERLPCQGLAADREVGGKIDHK